MEALYIHPLELKGRLIGGGDEGMVYRHNNRYAVKIFNSYYDERKRLDYKIAKVKDMMKLQDPSFTFPMGLVTTNGSNVNGYYTRYIGGKRSFRNIALEMNKSKILYYLSEAEAALKRIHKKGIIVGDLKEDNILIAPNNKPVFIDTDNYICGSHHFDLLPMRVGCFCDLYDGNVMDFKDNDKLLFALLSLEMLTKDPRFKYGSSRADIEQALKEHCKDREAKEILDCIFSDAVDKPYIGPVLKKIN